MRLELKAIAGASTLPASRTKWFFEQGKRTLGRSPDCDWQVPEDQRSVSKLHCTIERDTRGFMLRDQSANGSRVDGIVVHEGETARLSDQSRLDVGSMSFSVVITGEAHQDVEDPDGSYAMSDEPLTISSILADIAPGGRTATGLLGNRMSEDWLEPIVKKDGPSPSRNVDIGWNGPPEIRAGGNLLPDDWNIEDKKADHSDYSNYLEHGSATHVTIPVAKARVAEALPTVNDNAPKPDIEPVKAPLQAAAPARSAEMETKLNPLLQRIEDALEASFAAFGLELPAPEHEDDFFSRDRQDTLVTRIEELATRQAKLQAALENLVHHAGQEMDPRIIESRIDVAGSMTSFGFLRGRDYWQAYKNQFEKNDRTLSVQDVFRDAMMRTEDGDRIANLAKAEREDLNDEK
ncbi:FHA domain-containing protein [Neorhizobium sp. JUb45]|uniref:FHA domain-containing protein n=1 Tax=unclassified Neorhizobium TaxID=2629175 RepID=UPI00104834FC|nr:FHA domain-containing protein [Neorhizobium sp. JUb45]TCR02921.1 FHA domain protein [Neorhizobium sp. JUb45]